MAQEKNDAELLAGMAGHWDLRILEESVTAWLNAVNSAVDRGREYLSGAGQIPGPPPMTSTEIDEMAFTLAYARTELIRAWAQIEMLHNASPADPATQARTARKDEVSARIADVLGKYADATKLREREGATNGQA